MSSTPNIEQNDRQFMAEALKIAKLAWELHDEVPIGCAIVQDGKILSRGMNLKESLQQASAHAEILAINDACKQLGRWRLNDCTLYVTIEPCAMCAGAILQARIPRVVYGASEPKFGCVDSVHQLLQEPAFNHSAKVTSGVLADESKELIQSFFKQRR